MHEHGMISERLLRRSSSSSSFEERSSSFDSFDCTWQDQQKTLEVLLF
jgi:hypothetical protein